MQAQFSTPHDRDTQWSSPYWTTAPQVFLVEGSPVANLKIAQKPITITLPNCRTIQSTHTCNLDIPWLPDTMTEAYIVPGLALSTRKCCAAGCKITFDQQ